MAASTKVRGVTIDQLLANLLSGVNEQFPSGSSLVINGVTYDKAGLGQQLQQVISPFKTAEDLHTQLANAVKARDSAEPTARDFAEKVVIGLQYLFGTDANAMAGYGITPPKQKRQLTAQEQVARAAKAAETRKLRNTMGSRKKQEVKAQGDAQVTVTLPPPASNATSSPGSTAVTPAGSGSTSSSPTAASNGATGPQEVNGAAH